jgi:hypothetical protein
MEQERADYADHGPKRRLPSMVTLALIGAALVIAGMVAWLGLVVVFVFPQPGPAN